MYRYAIVPKGFVTKIDRTTVKAIFPTREMAERHLPEYGDRYTILKYNVARAGRIK
jgi:hypothetical protein